MRLLPVGIQLLLADPTDVGEIACFQSCLFARWIIIGFVQTQMGRRLFARFGSLDDNGLQSDGQQLGIVGISATDRQG